MRYSRLELETTTSSLWETQTKTAKKDYFTKNLSPPTFFEINTSNFQEMFLGIFIKFCGKVFLKNNRNKINNKKKN